MSDSTTLFHYTSGNNLKSILEKDQLFCSNINFLNDPSEVNYFGSLVAEILKKYVNFQEVYKLFFNESYLTNVLSPYTKYVASFSKNPDSLSMWNYYGKGNGYCIGLNIGKIAQQNHSNYNPISMVSVLYDSTEQEKLLIDFFAKHSDKVGNYYKVQNDLKKADEDSEAYWILDQLENRFSIDFMEEYYDLSMSFKHSAFSNEEEVRLVMSPDESSKSYKPEINFRVSPIGIMVPYIQINLSLSNYLTSIKAHPLSNEMHLEGLRIYLSENGFKIPEIEVSKSNIPFREL